MHLSAPIPLDVPALAGVWRASELGHSTTPVQPTGHAALDAVLPGGGWPLGGLTELLQGPAHSEWRLLLPALAALQRRPQPAPVVLVGAPHTPMGPALAAQGAQPSQWLWVQGDTPAARLWATGQALQCREVLAVIAWLPDAQPAGLRRLQVAAQQHSKWLWVWRPASARGQASPAPLRLALHASSDPAARLEVTVFKRRGPALTEPVVLGATAPPLTALLSARPHGGQSARLVVPAAQSALWPTPMPVTHGAHAVDRLAANDPA